MKAPRNRIRLQKRRPRKDLIEKGGMYLNIGTDARLLRPTLWDRIRGRLRIPGWILKLLRR